MIDSAKSAQQLGLDDPLTEAEWSKVKQDVLTKVKRRKMWRRSAKVLVSSLLIGTALLGWKMYPSLRHGDEPKQVAKVLFVEPTTSGRATTGPGTSNVGPCTVRFPDGSVVNLLDSWSTLTSQDATSEQIDVELVNGSGRFEIVHDAARHFRVRAGSVLLDVIGTVFTLDKVGEQVRVAVQQGSVQLFLPGRDALVSEGQVGIYPSATNTGADNGQDARATVFATRIGETHWW